MAVAANITAFIPEAHTLFTVVQGTLTGSPAFNAACLAGDCPRPAVSTQPIKTSSTSLGFIVVLPNAPFIAIAPSSVADVSLNAPQKLPIGVRAAATITALRRGVIIMYVLFI
jgi:hypothetical protein